MSPLLDESVLDDPDRIARADREGLLRSVATAGAQLRESVQRTAEAGLDEYLDGVRPRAVLLACDAPARPAALAIAALASHSDVPAPVLVHDEPTLPVWVGAADLVLAGAYTGADERTSTVADAAARRGVPVVGAGLAPSLLEEVCVRGRAPYVPVAAGRPPSATFWALLAPLLVAAGRVGLAEVTREDLASAADLLDSVSDRCRPTSETFVNPAKSLAVDLAASLPVVWGTSPLAGAAAHRFAGQLAARATFPAIWGALPHVAYHDGGVLDGGGLSDTGPEEADFFADRVDEPAPRRPRLVLLRDLEEAPDVRGQVEIVADSLRQRAVPVTELAAEEGGPVTRLASLVALLDFASVYTGLVLGVDPAATRTGQVTDGWGR
jgi:glucose/mannose-6-phosphate isomerase